MKEVLSADEAAEFLGLSKVTVLRRARAGDIPCRRMGQRKLFFLRKEIMGWVNNLPGRRLQEVLRR
jgi:excisionase family DNA binding protein